jgi:hypothetical protein
MRSWPFLLSLAFACKADPKAARNDPSIAALRLEKAAPAFRSEVVLHERDGKGKVAYLGLDVDPKSPAPGDLVELTHYFQVVEPMTGDWDVFVHGETAEGQRILVADHAPVFGKLPILVWERGEIWADKHRVLIPPDAPPGTIVFFAGLFKGDVRATVEGPPGSQDGKDRVRAAVIQIGQAPQDDLPETTVKRASSKITPDGKLDEADWQSAEVLTFADSMGRNIELRFPTKLRLLYDDVNLYVGFDSTDADITERYSKRDDPIYDHETVEVFLMPAVRAPEVGPYVELQASPGGVIFDASFTGRRQGMDKSFDAGQVVGTVLDGTLDTEDRDRGWVSEWVVPFAKIKWLNAPPKPGDEWRMNAFRIEKFREEGQTEGEYSAWSPPRVGDFHNTVRFGRMKFGP